MQLVKDNDYGVLEQNAEAAHWAVVDVNLAVLFDSCLCLARVGLTAYPQHIGQLYYIKAAFA